MRDEIPVTEQEEAAWREMERRQQQAARPAATPSAGQVLTDEEIAACYSAARPAGARRSGTTYAICRAVEAAVLAKVQPPSGQSAADEIEGLRAHVALLKTALAQAERESDELRARPGAATPNILREYAEGRIDHAGDGLCPDAIEGHGSRDPDCPVCRALDAAAPVPADAQAIRNAVLEEAAAAVEQHDRTGRSWVPDSLWGNITREAAGRIRALKGNSHGE